MSPWHQVALNDGWIEKASLRTTNPKAKMKQWIFVNLIASLPTMS